MREFRQRHTPADKLHLEQLWYWWCCPNVIFIYTYMHTYTMCTASSMLTLFGGNDLHPFSTAATIHLRSIADVVQSEHFAILTQ